jgi:hypothetical protein
LSGFIFHGFSNYKVTGYKGNRAPSECSKKAARAKPITTARAISGKVVFMVSVLTGYRWPGFHLARVTG